jgi:hypothetical protein
MYEWCDTTGRILREYETENDAMDAIAEYGVIGDYVWDNDKQEVAVAKIEKLGAIG